MGYPSSKRVSGKIKSGQSVWGSFSMVSETSKRKASEFQGQIGTQVGESMAGMWEVRLQGVENARGGQD